MEKSLPNKVLGLGESKMSVAVSDVEMKVLEVKVGVHGEQEGADQDQNLNHQKFREF